MAFPPPIAYHTEFSPEHLREASVNMSGLTAISGGTTRQQQGFVAGLSLSAAVALLWSHGLGLYRLSARDALFLRQDVATAILKAWRPADEFECWRNLCADLGLTENFMNLSAMGVYSHLMPRMLDYLRPGMTTKLLLLEGKLVASQVAS